MTVHQAICNLTAYGIRTGLVDEEDEIYTVNRLLEILDLNEYLPPESADAQATLPEILSALLEDAASRGLLDAESIVAKDLFDTKLMGALTPPPSVVRAKFEAKYAVSPKEATDWFYRFSGDTNYIRRDRIVKDVKWMAETPYGEIDLTINLSKPEKDPKAIAAAKTAKQSGYPKCLLCVENEGYAGRLDSPARQNHRILPLTMNGQAFCFQYSPYVYYNEHCIVFNRSHTPMKIDRAAFRKLLDFVTVFPHYFLGSNADLPIVGGSILTHDHFQGGRYTFAMERAEVEEKITFTGFEDVQAGIVKWPLTVLRIRSASSDRLVELADRILAAWRGYTDEKAQVYAETEGEPHNTITPIARRRGEEFELDLVLRNNLATKEHPLGLYHPHAELHHIKKENIGLIEVMGLAVLPARLKAEMELLATYLCEGKDPRREESLAKHADWADELKARYTFTEENADGILKAEIGRIFTRVLEDAGVYRCTPEGRAALHRFLDAVNA